MTTLMLFSVRVGLVFFGLTFLSHGIVGKTHGTAPKPDAPECAKFWEQRRQTLDQPVFHLPPAPRCPATRMLLLAYALVNGSAQDCSLSDMIAFADRFPLWPHRDHILPIIESQLLSRAETPEILETWFYNHGPQTVKGMLWYGAYLKKEKKQDLLRKTVSQFWTTRILSEPYQKLFWDAFRAELTPNDHRRRVLNHCLLGNLDQASWTLKVAGSQLPKVSHECLRRLQKPSPFSEAMLSRIQAHTPEYVCVLIHALERLQKERKKASSEHYGAKAHAAYTLLHQYDRQPLASMDPMLKNRLHQARHDAVRALVFKRRYVQAYALARTHSLTSGQAYVEAEKYCGWLALRCLKKPRQALVHFQNALQKVTHTEHWVGLQFWLGQTWDVLKHNQDAQAAYRRSARYGHLFYGQQSLPELVPTVQDYQTLSQPQVSLHGQRTLTPSVEHDLAMVLNQMVVLRTSMFQDFLRILAGIRFSDAVINTLISRLVKHGESSDRIYGYKFLSLDHPYLQVSQSFYPQFSMTPHLCSGVSSDLWLGVVHDESAFNPKAISPAGAHGLMQLIPNTAASLAKKEKIVFCKDALCSHPELNIRLGCAYIRSMLDKFPPSVLLTVAAYNAGPTRVNMWIKELGIPEQNINVLDWIESIPIVATKNYVQSTLAHAQMYHYWRTGRFLSKPFETASYRIP